MRSYVESNVISHFIVFDHPKSHFFKNFILRINDTLLCEKMFCVFGSVMMSAELKLFDHIPYTKQMVSVNFHWCNVSTQNF